MKPLHVRIYFDGYKNHYIVQYRWFGIWRNYKKYIGDWDFGCWETRTFVSESDALVFVAKTGSERKELAERRAAAIERDKKSGVVYQTII